MKIKALLLSALVASSVMYNTSKPAEAGGAGWAVGAGILGLGIGLALGAPRVYARPCCAYYGYDYGYPYPYYYDPYAQRPPVAYREYYYDRPVRVRRYYK